MPLDTTFWGAPVAEEICDEEDDYLARVRGAAFTSFSRQLLALCDEQTPHAIWELARYWQLEALR